MKEFLKNFSTSLRAARGDRSQAEMARILGLKQPTYLRYETGENEPSVTVAYSMAKKIGVSVEQLLMGTEMATAPGSPSSKGDVFPRVKDAVSFIADQMGLSESDVLASILDAVKQPR